MIFIYRTITVKCDIYKVKNAYVLIVVEDDQTNEVRSVIRFLYFLAHRHIVPSQSRISPNNMAHEGGSMTGTGKLAWHVTFSKVCVFIFVELSLRISLMLFLVMEQSSNTWLVSFTRPPLSYVCNPTLHTFRAKDGCGEDNS